jgi:16S rRNA (guanine(966)-N(2))-methyltransferase RsmD
MMRVIAGKARRIQLHSIAGDATRPMLDRVKESLFMKLEVQGRIADAQVLDLYAGSGAVGIEALSRGAAHAVFVEKSPACMRVLRDNLKRTHLTDQAKILQTDVRRALEGPLAGDVFDLVFCDPPFKQTTAGLDADGPLAQSIGEHLAQQGLAILRTEKKAPAPDHLGRLVCAEQCVWGRSAVWLYAHPEGCMTSKAMSTEGRRR